MLSENLQELSALLKEEHEKDLRLNGYGATLSRFDSGFFGALLDTRADDFPGTEALFFHEVSPAQKFSIQGADI